MWFAVECLAKFGDVWGQRKKFQKKSHTEPLRMRWMDDVFAPMVWTNDEKKKKTSGKGNWEMHNV